MSSSGFKTSFLKHMILRKENDMKNKCNDEGEGEKQIGEKIAERKMISAKKGKSEVCE